MARRSFQIGWLQFNSAATKLALAVVVGSIVAALSRNSLYPWLILNPPLVRESFALWQPITYALIAGSPLSVLFSALILVSIGGALEASWGSRRFLTFAIGISAVSGLLTVALSFVLPERPYTGAEVMVSAIWVAYGLLFGSRQTNFWGLPVTGYTFALIGVGFVFLNGAFSSWLNILPEAIALALTFAFLRFGSPRILLLKFQSWRLQHQLRGRAKHLRLITKDRNTPTDSDRYLH